MIQFGQNILAFGDKKLKKLNFGLQIQKNVVVLQTKLRYENGKSQQCFCRKIGKCQENKMFVAA